MASRHKKRTAGHPAQFLALVLIGAGLLVMGVAALILLPKPGASAESDFSAIPAQVDFPAPELALTDLDGSPVALSDYRGQVVLVNNWATWCPPCKAEMPTLQAYFEAHQAKGFTIIAIEGGEPVSEVADFVRQYGLSFPVWPDVNGKSMDAFRNLNLPNSYLIDREGTVRLAWTGAISRSILEEYVTPLLED